MSRDIAQWKDSTALSEDDTADYQTQPRIFYHGGFVGRQQYRTGTYRHVAAPECRQYLLRQGFEEAINSLLTNTLSRAWAWMRVKFLMPTGKSPVFGIKITS